MQDFNPSSLSVHENKYTFCKSHVPVIYIYIANSFGLISFTARKEEGSNLLQWSTASEVNTSHFEIQSSGEGECCKPGQISISRQKRLQTQQWIRIEKRFNRKISNDQLLDGSNFNFRFRYLLTLMVPLNRDFIEPKTLFFAFNDEIHINAGKQITYNLFDQNRFFVGLGYQFTKGLNIQAGYMNQFQQLPSGNHFNSNNVLRLFVFHNLDMRSKK